MKERIRRAYDAVCPAEETEERILAELEGKATFRESGRSGRKLMILAAAAAMLGCGVYAGYQQWRLPQPETYEPDPDGGIYSVETENVYESWVSEQQTTQAEEHRDEYFLEQAVLVLEAAGLTDVDTGMMRLVRQENLVYGRQEAEVFFENGAVHTSVKFDASFGHLLSLSSIDWQEDAQQTVRSPEELAREYYEKLPVAQGYVQMEQVEKYDEQYWSYSFCKEVQPGLYSYYEMVRISVNPISGRLVGCNVFDFPLLDDHKAEDVPLTREEAVALVQQVEQVNLEGYVLESAEIAVVLPNWWFTEYMDGDLQYCDISRLGWVLTYVRPDSEFADEVTVWIDLYTGQVLGGGMV